MDDKIDLSLPEEIQPRAKREVRHHWVLWLMLLIVGVNTVVLLAVMRGRGGAVEPAGTLDAGARKQLALKLEKQGLHSVAAEAWREYLDVARLNDSDAARIWYRIGVICQDADDYERALAAFYRSESAAKLDGLDLEISRRIQECLEAMGKFAALRHALDERVGVGESAGKDASEVVAEIGARKITSEKLDQMIEDYLDQQLASIASVLGEEQRNARKEEMLKQFSSASQRMQLLNQFIFEELLYREAIDSELAKDSEVRKLLREQERRLLASMVLDRDVTKKVRIEPADIEAYYEAHQSDFVEEKDGEQEQKPLSAVRGQVYQIVRAMKEQDLQQQLFEKLIAENDVVIHRSAFGAEGSETE